MGESWKWRGGEEQELEKKEEDNVSEVSGPRISWVSGNNDHSS